MWFTTPRDACVRCDALLRYAFTAAFVAACLSACTSWETVEQSPRDLIAEHPKAVIRAVLTDGSWMTLHRAFIRNDSLGGITDTARTDAQPVLTALKNVHHLEIERVDGGKTALAVIGVGASAALIYSMVDALSNMSFAPSAPSMNMKFSCPLVYSWDGHHWRLDSGTFGGAIAEALQRTDVDNLDYAVEEGGLLRLRVANELAETDHLDALAVVAVDHDPDVAVAPGPDGALHTIGTLEPPLRATDDRGVDALPRVLAADGWSWESAVMERDASNPADLRSSLELVFARPAGATRAHLVVDANSSEWGTLMLAEFIGAHGRATQAWYDTLNAHPAAARAMQSRLGREAFLAVSVRTDAGWRDQGLLWEAGPEIVKRQVLDIDLSQVTGDTVFVRLTSAPSFWKVDRVALDFTSDRAVTMRELRLVSAREAGGRDVAPLIAAVDHQDYALSHGASAEVVFAAPPVPAGMARTYLLRSTGWYRVDSPETGEPDVAALRALGRDSLAVGRASVQRLNLAITRFAEAAR